MADWELLVPGIGLTVLGLAGMALSLAGIAKTFMEGMHAMSALMMFIGMIILAAGILKDGLPRSNQAKAAALVIVGFAATLGAFAVGIAEVPVLVTLTGILFLIIVPAVIIAWAAHKRSPHLKAIAILFSSGSVVGIIAFSIFGYVAPQPIEAGLLEETKPPEEPEITGPVVEISIPTGASVPGSKAYDPDDITVAKGTTIIWINNDNVVHTVTSGTIEEPNFGELFDSGSIRVNGKWSLNTAELEPGTYVYFCTFHPLMTGKFTVSEGEGIEKPISEEKTSAAVVDIVLGAANPSNPAFYVPAEITVEVGTTVVWTNSDTAAHTVTSGDVSDPDSWGQIFDSGFPLMQPAEKFEFTFKERGEYPYFCQVHPWMVGKVIVA
ncbi:MAG: plastocyanin/azurin family copper-binding protein [Nitrososphaerales archaeon]